MTRPPDHISLKDVPCEHCGLPVGRHPVGSGPYFCCTGCQIVFDALDAAGMGETYYRLKGAFGDEAKVIPADTRLDDLVLSELDSVDFLTEHARPVDGGGCETELFLDGVHCAACVWLVERLPYVMDGVEEARLDLPRARLSLRWRPDVVRLSDVARWLAGFGYRAGPVRRHESVQRTDAERRLLKKVGVSWALAGNVMLIAFALYAGLDAGTDTELAAAARWLSMLLAIPAVVYGGSEFFGRAWRSVRLSVQTRQLKLLHMDTPIALGILVGTADSIRATITGHGDVWYDSITVLIAALLTARWLQLRSRRLAGDATERLLGLIPTMARRVDHARAVVETVRIDQILPGDVVDVPAGEVFPVDGFVQNGRSMVNNAVLTGESRPEPVADGDAVTAGATNLTSPLHVRVVAAGEATRVGQLLAWVRDASEHSAPVILLANRLSAYFVLTVLAVALATTLLWLYLAPSEAARHVVALLVITCPCALGMATPLAMAVASGKAARAGIFIKSDEATQQLAHINAVVLDKTGTLTEGAMTLVEWEGDEDALDLAAVLETQSLHPIAQAVVQARSAGFRPWRGTVSICTDRLGDLVRADALRDGLRVGLDAGGSGGMLGDRLGVGAGSGGSGGMLEDRLNIGSFTSVAGQGIRGRVSGREVMVGSPSWVSVIAAELLSDMAARAVEYAASGYTPVAVAVDGRPAAILAVGDRIRDDAAEIVSQLLSEGKDVYLLSGDHPEVAAAVGGRLGIPPPNILGGVSPEEKQRFIEMLRANGGRIAMIGDGVNDAAALQAADVGIAVHGGSTASLVAADIFLTRAGLKPVAKLLAGGRHTMHVIHRNLGISLAYNILAAGAAVAGLVSPLVAAVAMPISSLFVVASSILQRSFRPAAGAPRPGRSILHRESAASATKKAA